MLRVLQWVALGGVVCNVASTTARIFFSETFGLRPGRGASFSSPAIRSARKRSRQSCTVGREILRVLAMSWLKRPSAAIVMIFARNTFRYGRLRAHAHPSRVERSSGVRMTGAAVLLITKIVAYIHHICQVIYESLH